jgi:putative flippase GtrA
MGAVECDLEIGKARASVSSGSTGREAEGPESGHPKSGEPLARTIRFALVGVIGTAAYFGIAVGLASLGVGITIAHWTAYVISQFVSYLGQKNFTFRIRGQNAQSAPRFLAAMAMLALAQYLVVLGAGALHLGPTMIFLAGSIFYPVASWALHTSWTFRPSSEAKAAISARTEQ